MVIREDIVASAVTFLQDPNVSGSPIENRIAFLHSKNLTNEEVETALARAGKQPNTAPFSGHTALQVARGPPPPISGYQQYSWHSPPPKRDWRDWFILTTVMGGMGFGLYHVVKRYIYPLIAPPTAPQIEQDKKAIDESFERVFVLIDQLAKDTEELKDSENTRTTRLDVALTEVENTLSNIKLSSRRGEDESRRITEEVRSLKELIPRAMEEQKEVNESQLKEVNAELKSLKILLGQRMNSSTPTSSSLLGRGSSPGMISSVSQARNTTDDATGNDAGEKIQTSNSILPMTGGSSSPGQSSGLLSTTKAAIPSWQLAANRNPNSTNSSANVSQESNVFG